MVCSAQQSSCGSSGCCAASVSDEDSGVSRQWPEHLNPPDPTLPPPPPPGGGEHPPNFTVMGMTAGEALPAPTPMGRSSTCEQPTTCENHLFTQWQTMQTNSVNQCGRRR